MPTSPKPPSYPWISICRRFVILQSLIALFVFTKTCPNIDECSFPSSKFIFAGSGAAADQRTLAGIKKNHQASLVVSCVSVTFFSARGSELSAAGGRVNEVSEWLRSTRNKPALSGAVSVGHRNRNIVMPSASARWTLAGIKKNHQVSLVVSCVSVTFFLG